MTLLTVVTLVKNCHLMHLVALHNCCLEKVEKVLKARSKTNFFFVQFGGKEAGAATKTKAFQFGGLQLQSCAY